jgi:hypothetical protein
VSTLAERARIEAEEAEAENPDESEEAEEAETQPEPEPEPAPEPPAAQMTEQDAEREFKKLETAAQTYLKKAMPITEKLGMPVQACPLCTFPGLAIPRQAHEVTSDVETAVLALIGKAQPPAFKESPQYRRCDACDGFGEVLTGAQKEISRTAPCNLCGGKGYVTGQIVTPGTPLNGAPAYPGAELPHTPLPQGIPDAWGRPAGHIHWGIDPANVGA